MPSPMNTTSKEDSLYTKIEAVWRASTFPFKPEESSWKRSIWNIFFEALQKSLGTEILLRIPPVLAKLPTIVVNDFNNLEKLKRAGLIQDIQFGTPYPDEPPLMQVYAKGNQNGAGANFFDIQKAMWCAIGEAIERSLWSSSSEWYAGKTVKTSAKTLRGAKLDLHTISGFSDIQRSEEQCLCFDDNSVFTWIRVRDILLDKDIWAPLQLFSAEYSSKNSKKPNNLSGEEPLLRWEVTTGLANSSNSFEEATLQGTLEIIERDAFMISYLSRISPPRINLDNLEKQDSEISEIIHSLKRYRLELELLLLPTDFSVNVVSAVIIDKTGKGPSISLGAKASYNLKTAVLGAISESLSVRHFLKSVYKEPIDETKITRKERLIYWAQPENLTKITFLISGEKTIVSLRKEDGPRDVKEQLALLKKDMQIKQYQLLVANLNSEASRKMGFHCVYVFSPNLHPLHLNERLPYIGGQRLKDTLASLRRENIREVNLEPHPFP